MIESVVNSLELLITGICMTISICFVYAGKQRIWVLMSLFCGTFFLGDLYWQLHLIFYKRTPLFSFIPYLSWYASFLFLYLMLLLTGNRGRIHSRKMWLIPVFTFGMCIYYMQFGAYVSNLISALLMTLIILQSVKGLSLPEKTGPGRKKFCLLTLLFCALEYGIWTSSCFDYGNPLRNLYYVFSVIMIFSFPICLMLLYKNAADISISEDEI